MSTISKEIKPHCATERSAIVFITKLANQEINRI